MKVALIIPLHNQLENWPKIVKGIENQTIVPDRVIAVLDRPSDDDEMSQYMIDTKLNITYPVQRESKENKDKFMAPHNRNVGIQSAIKDDCDIFIFIDGDCIPQNKLIESHINKLKYGIPVLSVGRRRESIYRWQDRREYVPELSHLGLFPEDGLLINNTELLKNSLIVWSCNMALNLSAVKLLKRLNRKYFNRSEVFSSDFNGSWGGEDAYLGIQAHYCRILITTIGEKRSGIEHIDHPRPEGKYNMNHMELLNKQMETLRQKVRIHPLDVSFFIT